MTRTIAFLIFPDFQLLDAAGPISAFEIAARMTDPPAYRLCIVAREAGPVASSSGAALVAEPFTELGPVDTLIVAGGFGTRRLIECATTAAFIRAAAAQARRV